MRNIILAILVLYVAYDILTQHPELISDFKKLKSIDIAEEVMVSSEPIAPIEDFSYNANTGNLRSFVKGAVWHSTANTNPWADRHHHQEFMDTTRKEVSWNITCDQTGCYINVPLNTVTFHAGDRNVNQHYLGIEVCQNEGANVETTMKHVENLKRWLDHTYGDGFEHLTHHDITGKNCPSLKELKELIDKSNSFKQ